jgi:hypothetical protein
MKKILRMAMHSMILVPSVITWCAGLVLLPHYMQESSLSKIMLARFVRRVCEVTGLDFYTAFCVLLYGPTLIGLVALRWVSPKTNVPNKAAHRTGYRPSDGL